MLTVPAKTAGAVVWLPREVASEIVQQCGDCRGGGRMDEVVEGIEGVKGGEENKIEF